MNADRPPQPMWEGAHTKIIMKWFEDNKKRYPGMGTIVYPKSSALNDKMLTELDVCVCACCIDNILVASFLFIVLLPKVITPQHFMIALCIYSEIIFLVRNLWISIELLNIRRSKNFDWNFASHVFKLSQYHYGHFLAHSLALHPL